MDGVMFLSDEKNEKRYVQIDLNKYGSIVEDILDRIAIATTKSEETVPIDDLIKDLETTGNLNRHV